NSAITGSVRTDDGAFLQNVKVQFVQGEQSSSVFSDSAGRFAFFVAMPGNLTISFEYPLVPEVGSYTANLKPPSTLDLAVVLRVVEGSGPMGVWVIRERDDRAPSPAPPEDVLTQSYIESLPNTGDLWSLLNLIEPSVVADHYDASGF